MPVPLLYHKIMNVLCPIMAEKTVKISQENEAVHGFSKLCPILPAEYKQILTD